MPQANICDFSLLQPGMLCIVEVNDANHPTGIWWATVKDVQNRESYLDVKVHITGGRVAFIYDKFGYYQKPLYSNENQGMEVHVGQVYPSTETTQFLFSRLLKEQEQAQQNQAAAEGKIAALRELRVVVMAAPGIDVKLLPKG